MSTASAAYESGGATVESTSSDPTKKASGKQKKHKANDDKQKENPFKNTGYGLSGKRTKGDQIVSDITDDGLFRSWCELVVKRRAQIQELKEAHTQLGKLIQLLEPHTEK